MTVTARRLRVWVRQPYTTFGPHRQWVELDETAEVRRALQIGLLALPDTDGNPEQPPAPNTDRGCGCR